MFPNLQQRLAAGLLGVVVVAVTAAAPTAGGAPQPVRPVIGSPVTVPGQALPGQRLTVSFKVTRSDTHRPLLRGRMICDPSVAAVVIPHAESFTAGTARLSFVVPMSAHGKQLKVKVTIMLDRQSATRIAMLRVAELPTLAIEDSTVAEGNTGMTTLSLPVRLSAPSAQTVSVGYSTADATANAPTDYVAANGTLTFAPGEIAKMIPISVVGDTILEPDETFTVTLANPVNASLVNADATGTIENDDLLAQPGHYKGTTSQNELFEFDVAPGATGISGLRTGQINLACTPPDYYVSGGNLDLGSNLYPVSGDGSFTIDVNLKGTLRAGAATTDTSTHVVITGHLHGDTASGSLLKSIQFTLNNIQYACSSNPQTWTATRTS